MILVLSLVTVIRSSVKLPASKSSQHTQLGPWPGFDPEHIGCQGCHAEIGGMPTCLVVDLDFVSQVLLEGTDFHNFVIDRLCAVDDEGLRLLTFALEGCCLPLCSALNHSKTGKFSKKTTEIANQVWVPLYALRSPAGQHERQIAKEPSEYICLCLPRKNSRPTRFRTKLECAFQGFRSCITLDLSSYCLGGQAINGHVTRKLLCSRASHSGYGPVWNHLSANDVPECKKQVPLEPSAGGCRRGSGLSGHWL